MAYQIIQSEHLELIRQLVNQIPGNDIQIISTDLANLIDEIRCAIPEKRRISTGRYSIIKALGEELHPLLREAGLSPFEYGRKLLDFPEADSFVRALGLMLLVAQTLADGALLHIQPCFETAAKAEDWILRECASGFIRPLIKTFPDEIREWYLKLVGSNDPNLRRFVSESLRPVVENHWFHKQPSYALDIIAHLFQESAAYPRTSVGNNLSDWMRVDMDTAWPIVEKLARSGNKNSHWIAYRACRNYVKKEPLKVMDLLNIEEYKYKNRHYRRADLK